MAARGRIKRVVMVLDWHPNSVGGTQTHVRGLAETLRRWGIETLIVSRELGKSEIRDLKIEGYYPVKSLFNVDFIAVPPEPSSVRNVIRKLDPDIVHSHHIFTLTSLMALKEAHELGIPSVITNHSIFYAYDKRSVWRVLGFLIPTRYFLGYADAIISVSSAADKMVESLLDKPKPRFIIPNGIDVEKYKPPEREPDDPVVFFVGRLVYRKGPHVLVKAFRLVVDEVKDARLIIAGKGFMEPVLRTMVKKLGLEGRVEMLGVVPEWKKIELYRSSALVAVPSIANESFGIVAIEAMASGRPVVATRHGGLSDVVEHGETGFLVKPGSSRELAEAIITLLEDRKLREKMGSKARSVAVEKYSWDKVAQRILRVYEYVVESRERG
jgi:glycosyltransferase involved in cell wall biosynthesis